MRYVNARNTAYGEDRRTYKETDSGVSSTQRVFNVSYDNGRVEAYLNGVRLFPDDDYTKTSSGIGTSITLASDLGSNNVLEVVGYQGINSGNALVEDNFVVGTGSTGSGGSYTNSTTVFPVASSAGDTVSVWRNGVKLVPTTDYTVSVSAQTVTLVSAASSADEITVQVVGGVIHNNGLTVNSGNDSFFLPTTRGTDNYVLTRDDSVGTGGTTWKETALAPTITSIKYSEQTSGTFVENTGQTATEASASTPELCQIIGTNFDNSMTITVGGTSAGSVTVDSTTQATFTPPSKTAGSYTLTATNPNGLNATTTIAYDADPAWVTGANADLGDFQDGTISGTNGPQIVASESGSNLTTGYKQVTSNTDNTVITSGVAGLTIGDNGYLTGTLAGTNGATNNFYAIAVDNEGQQSAIRQFHFVSYDYAGNGGDTDPTNSGNTIKYHVFTTTGTSYFQVISSSLTIDILLVAGGAGSGLAEAGGGGAGEVVWKTGLTLSAGTYNVVVGAGGVGTNKTISSPGRATNGEESSFAWGVSGKQIRAKGGGAGGRNGGGEQSGLSGGSGGGTSRDGGSGSAGSASKYGTGTASDQQGIGFAFNGGATSGTSWASASGGGGAGAVGGNGSGNGSSGDGGNGGAGGIGFKGSDVGTDVTNLMNDTSIGVAHGGVRYIAGGGGGSAAYSGSAGSLTAGAGGYGGGGAGALDSNAGTGVMATAGTANTGGGAGGGLRGATGVNGGSGIIVIRYAI